MTPANSVIVSSAERFIAISTEKAKNLFEAGYTGQAIELYREIMVAFPGNDKVLLIMAKMFRNAGRIEEALPLLRNIPHQSIYYADALSTLGMILVNRRDFEGGAECFALLVELDVKHINGYNNLALCLMELGRPVESEKFLRKAIQMSPEHVSAYFSLGKLFARYWRLEEAREQFQRVIELQSDHADAYTYLAGIAVLELNTAEAEALLGTAIKLQPNNRTAADNLLFNLNYSDSHTPEQVRDEHLRLADFYNTSVQEQTRPMHRQGGKIRVGYVSGDFRSHSVAFFLEPVLRNHNRDEYEIFCYDMVSAPDDTTRRMMGLGWEWRPVCALSDRAVADQIQSDSIDVLVDLAGHTSGNRLGVFAMRPAPVQVTWLGYPNTTGLKQIDYRLTDNLADPAGLTDHLYSEKLIRLPQSFLCYAPLATAPPVKPMSDGPITFCSFNNYPKATDTVLRLWARILIAVPEARLLIKCGPLEDLRVRTQLSGRFAALGIDPARLILDRGTVSREEHLQRYGVCHIALDTYPYNGTTTTCEALWMGVPVVTLAGRTHASRVGLSLLNNAGLSELVALNPDQYVDIAVTLANSPARLQEYRRRLRDQLSGSPLLDAKAFTKQLEQAYRWMLDQFRV